MNAIDLPPGSQPAFDDEGGWMLPDEFNYAVDVIDRWAADPNRVALKTADSTGRTLTFTYAQVSDLSRRFASGLRSHGVRKGDAVIILLPRIAEWQIAMIACARLGAVAVPCIEMLTAGDVDYRLRHSGAIAVITTAANCAKFTSADDLIRVCVDGSGPWIDYWSMIRADSADFRDATVSIDDPAVLYYTSGSTGSPKGVLHAARALFAWRVSAQYWHSLTETDTMWCTADTGWSKAGTAVLFAPWSTGCAVFIYDGPFDPAERWQLMRDHSVSVFCASATELRQVTSHYDPDSPVESLRLVTSAGEALDPGLIKLWDERVGVPLRQGYGQTETLMTIAAQSDDIPPGSIGTALPGTELAVIHADGSVLLRGSGELAVRLPNPQVMLTYLHDDERMASNIAVSDGLAWWKTGDIVTIDDSGFVSYDGRTDDIINSAGYRIGPMEVESVMLQHPQVVDCAVVSSPDPDRGEVVKAFVVLDGDTLSDEQLVTDLQAFVKSRTAPYKYPRRIQFVPNLPKTPTGKVNRRALRELEWSTGENDVAGR